MTETPNGARRRVVITGLGVVSPVGSTVETFWSALVAGRSGLRLIDRFDTADLPSKVAGLVTDFEPDELLGRKAARRMDRATQMAVATSQTALADSRLEVRERPDDVAVCFGAGCGCPITFETEHATFQRDGARRVSPFLVPMAIPNAIAGTVSIHLGARGPAVPISTACATGTDCIGHGAALIRAGIARQVIAGGVDAAVTPFIVAGFGNAKALTKRSEPPEGTSCPFDRRRDGFVIAEGGAAVILEERESAIARGATIYAELLGYAATSDAYHATAPEETGSGAARAMRRALEDGGLRPEDVGYVNAHGTSTPLNDAVETRAIKLALGDHAYRVPISSIKSMTGHLLGGAGAVEIVATVLALGDGVIPPTINLHEPDPECDLDYVPNVARRADLQVAMSNSLGFGGHNSSIVVARPDYTGRGSG